MQCLPRFFLPMKLCPKCKISPEYVRKGNRSRMCQPCWNLGISDWGRRNPDKVKNKHLRHKYGITFEEYRRMELVQGGLCAICRKPENPGRSLAVDHNHTTGQVRALLCGNCNRGIGMLQDSADLLRAAAEYLETYAS